MIRFSLFLLTLLLVISRLFLGVNGQSRKGFPSRPVRIVVPYLAGGGTDTFARVIQKSLNQKNLYGVPVVIENRDGGSATIGSRFVKEAKPDGYRILCHHEGMIATQLAGVVPYGPEAFQPIAQTGSIVLLMIVRADSPYQTLPELLAAAQNRPNEIRMGANQGSPAFFLCKQMLSEYTGAEFNFVSASGSRRFTYILGGKLEAGIFSLSEYLNFRKTGEVAADDNILAIANFGEKRHPAIPQVSTSREQGLKTSAENAYYFWAPQETPAEVVSLLAAGLEKALKDPETLRSLETMALEPTFRKGKALATHLQKRVTDFRKIATQATGELPDFVRWAFALTTVLGTLMILFSNSPGRQSANEESTGKTGLKKPLILLVVIGLYVVGLQFQWPFVILTPMVILLLGDFFYRNSGHPPPRLQRCGDLFCLGMIASVGIEFLFVTVFSLPLP